jgi:Putative exonuclease SbcCD, C subunit
LTEEEGAPLGLEAARRRLLNTNADLWSAEDRNLVGTMLQRRIATERERADAGAGREGGSLVDQLARALDYRRWHRFRVERWQDGQWRKLSGPASSGERALGLTVPLFAAVASFYSQGAYPLAPRLILLDEAFAGIDDAARAHCMGLIREFDLDFVITSEREWACYAELPGVAICHLQRREGVDAVFVSRWTWDGRARVREADPDRRFSRA